MILKRAVALTITTTTIALLFASSAFARLSLTPLRVELNTTSKIQSVLLMNETADVTTYRIGFRYQTMTPTGEIKLATEEEHKLMQPIEQMVMFSPKQVTLQPKQTQTVKFTFRKIPTATLSEYAAYIVFQELDDSPIIPQLSEQPDAGNVAIKVKPLFKISIPIFISDETSTSQKSAEINNMKIDKDLNVIMFDINNVGQYSMTGRIVAKFFKGKKMLGKFEQTNVSIPNPLKMRKILLQYDETAFKDDDITSIEATYLPPVGAREYSIAKKILELTPRTTLDSDK